MKLLLALTAVLFASAAGAQPTKPGDFPKELWASFLEQGAPEGLATIAGTGALFAFARPQDTTVQAAVAGPRRPVPKGLADAGTVAGNAGVLLGAMGAVYLSGWAARSDGAMETGALGLEALALGGLEAEALKYSARRRRPDGSDLYSFPSGHATESFAVATVLASRYGWGAGVPACLAAGFIGYTRLQNNKHWLSDVVAGTGLGVLAGRSVWRAHEGKRGKVAVVPWVAPGQAGALITARF